MESEAELERSFGLAYFLLRDADRARRITLDAADLVEVAARRQARRRYYRPIGRFGAKRRRNRVSMERAGLLQRLVLSLAEEHEREVEAAASASVHEEDWIVRYVAYLVRLGWRRNAFHLLVALGRLLFRYDTAEVLDLDALVGQDPDLARDDDYVRARKAVLRREVVSRFRDRLREQRGPRGARDIAAEPADSQALALVQKCLQRLVPWETSCPLPDRDPREFDPTSEPLVELVFDGGDPDGEHRIEIRRLHALTHPRCYEWLTAVLALPLPEDRLRIPIFEGVSDTSGPRPPGPSRRPPRLDAAELRMLAVESRQRRDRRRRTSLELLTAGNLVLRIDGGKPVPLRDGRAELRIPEGSERIDLLTADTSEIIAVLLLSADTEGRQISALPGGGRVLWDVRRQGPHRQLAVRVVPQSSLAKWIAPSWPTPSWRPALVTGLMVVGLLAGAVYLSDRLFRPIRPPVVRTTVEIESIRVEVAPEVAESRGLARRIETRLRAAGRWRLTTGPADLVVKVELVDDGLWTRMVRGEEIAWEEVYRPSERAIAVEELARRIESLSDEGTLPSPRTMNPDQ